MHYAQTPSLPLPSNLSYPLLITEKAEANRAEEMVLTIFCDVPSND
jgi:hypothetical protein